MKLLIISVAAALGLAASAFGLQVHCNDCSYSACMPECPFNDDPVEWNNCLDLCYDQCWQNCTIFDPDTGI